MTPDLQDLIDTDLAIHEARLRVWWEDWAPRDLGIGVGFFLLVALLGWIVA